VIGPLPALLWGFSDGMDCDGCPPSALLIEQNDTLRTVGTAVISVLGVSVVAVVLAILTRRWRPATPPQRRAMAPVLWSGVAMLILVGTALLTDPFGISRVTNAL